MKKIPLVSVIVAVYNIEDYVEDCLKTLVSQDYENLEIIVMDDGSTDKSGEICDKFASKKLRVVHRKNGGLSDTRNCGALEAKGDLICFVDGDDKVKKNYVSRLVEALVSSGANIAVCGFNKEQPKKRIVSGGQATMDLLIGQENINIVAWNKIYEKSLFVDNNIWYHSTGGKYEDSLTTYKLYAAAKKVVYIPDSLYIYNDSREGSFMNSGKKEEKLLAREKAAEEAVEYFSDKKLDFAGEREGLIAAAKVAVLLSKYAFLDFAIGKKIDKKYQKEMLRWLKQNWKSYKKNQKMSKKLKAYGALSTTAGGILYILFRKIRHEK